MPEPSYEGHMIAVAGTSREEIQRALPYARAIAGGFGGGLCQVGLVRVPEGESLGAGAGEAQRLRSHLEPLREGAEDIQVRVARDPWSELGKVLTEIGASLVFLSWSEVLPSDLLHRLPADGVVVNGDSPPSIKRILLPIRGGPYAALSLQVALAYARVHGAEITLLHAAAPARFRDEGFREFFGHLQSLPEITRWIRVRGEPVQAILENARPEEHQLLIMGAIARPQRGDPAIGPTARRIIDEAAIPALIVRTCPPAPESPLAPPAPALDYTISVVVDKWFGENTFAAHEFTDLKRLVEQKERQGLTISLGLPALNEEQTIGKVIRTVRRAFMEQYPLLDEIVLIDSNSTDKTVAIAEDLGVPVVRHQDILSQYGVYRGKGQALWSSLYALKGDLIAWIDTDIVNIHPRFVYGVLGPLIQNPRLMYVKGFYQRPLRVGRRLQAQGGGRVTELTARPLLNLFYPELSGLIQPLSGEYAGRRQALESVPFFTGYGVEIGLLIDILSRYGLASIGQVDLEERVHRNQTLLSLSKMAFAIIQVVLKRVGENRESEILNWMNASLKLIQHHDEDYRLELVEIRDHERPPMITIPEYRAWRESLQTPPHDTTLSRTSRPDRLEPSGPVAGTGRPAA